MIPRRRYEFPDRLGRMVAHGLLGGGIAQGPAAGLFARMMSERLTTATSRPDVILTASGRAALALVLERLGVAKGAAILLPAWTFGGVADSLRQRGWTVRLCDVGRDAPLMNLESVRAAWHPDVACVLYTHLFGQLADIEPVLGFSRDQGALVVEDCAHALGCTVRGGPVGVKADGALMSFDLLKTVATFGGGLGVINQGSGRCELDGTPPSDGAVLRKVLAGVGEDALFAGPWLRPLSAMLAHPGGRALIDVFDSVLRRGPPAQSGFAHLQGRVGIAQLLDLEERLQRRRAMARRVLGALGLADPQLDDDAELRGNAYFVVVRAADGENAGTLRSDLLAAGVDAGVGADVADDLSRSVASPLPHARLWARRALQLPCGAAYDEWTIGTLCQRLAPFRGRLCR